MKDDEMNIKFQNASPKDTGSGKNTGSCAALANYLEHEDEERKADGKDVLPFTDADGNPVSKEEVIDKIGRDNLHLSEEDIKFYHMVVAPSRSEILAMGITEKEVYRNARMLLKKISDAYAENFNREGIEDSSDVVIYWKPHFTRGDNDELQFHLHAIIRRKSKAGPGEKSVKLSPMSNHKHTENGPVKGGFDRKLFVSKCEKIFDKLFHYDRKVSETFEYQNIQKHGSPEEKAEQAKRLADEQITEDAKAIKNSIMRRRQNLKAKEDVARLEEMLKGENGESNPLEVAVSNAEIGTKMVRIFNEASSLDGLSLSLMMIGVSCVPVTGAGGGVTDIIIIRGGKKMSMSGLLDKTDNAAIIKVWCKLTGQKPEESVKSQQKEDKKILQVDPPKKKIGHKI